MPIYDFRCTAGHENEDRVAFGTDVISCPACGGPAGRVVVTSRPAGFVGFATPPMRERPIRLTDGLNALDEVHAAARKAGVEPPDLLGEAKRQAAVIQRDAPELVSGT